MRQVIGDRYLYCVVLGLCLWASGVAIAQASNALYGAGPERWIFLPEAINGSKGILRGDGYNVDSAEDLKRAVSQGRASVRQAGLHLLARNIGGQAIPTLRDGLEDSSPWVRCTAARLLGVLGDRSGLTRMRRDMGEFTKEYKEGISAQPDSPTGQQDKPRSPSLKGMRLRYAMLTAQVLAELGDTGGYDLAAHAALEHEFAIHRITAFSVLAELGRMDKAALEALGCDPESVLLTAADSETDPRALTVLVSSVQAEMRPESQIRILEKVLSSPHIDDTQRRITEGALKRARKRLTEEKQDGKDGESRDE